MGTTLHLSDPGRRDAFEKTVGHPVHVHPVPVNTNLGTCYMLDMTRYTDEQLQALATHLSTQFSCSVTLDELKARGCPIKSEGATIMIDDQATIITMMELAAASMGCGPSCPNWMGDGLCKNELGGGNGYCPLDENDENDDDEE